MAINFPTSLDSLTNPIASNPVTSPSHATQHANANDAIEALEAKVGADSSGVSSSHDYKITALGTSKQDVLVSGTNIKTINGSTILGSGNLTISGTGAEATFSRTFLLMGS